MNLLKMAFYAVVALVVAFSMVSQVKAHNAFKKHMKEKYGKKVKCDACHLTQAEIKAIDPNEKRKLRNNFGRLIQAQFESKTLTADYKDKKGAEKRVFEKEVMIPAFEKSFDKVKAMTVSDLIEAGFFEDIEDDD